jgi:hypothetical protein
MSVDARGEMGATALHFGVHNCNEGEGDYARVARLLIAAGAKIPSVDLPTGKPEVDAVLREHGLI